MASQAEFRGWTLPCFESGTLAGLKWLGLALMTLDHVDAFVFHRTLGFATQLGRLVFPIFAAVIAMNLARAGTLERGVYPRLLWRLAIFGLLAEPFHHAMATQLGGWWPLNIMTTFAAFAGICWLLELECYVIAVAVFLVAGGLVEYAWPGLALCLAIWHLYRVPSAQAAFLVVMATASLGILNGSQAALWAIPLLVLAAGLQFDFPRCRWAFYAYYPVHLAAFWLVIRFG